MKRLLAFLLETDPEPRLLDHVPVGPGTDPAGDTYGTRARAEKLVRAREKLGRPFKCAALDQDREVFVAPGVLRVGGAGRGASRRDVTNAEREAGERAIAFVSESATFDSKAWDGIVPLRRAAGRS